MCQFRNVDLSTLSPEHLALTMQPWKVTSVKILPGYTLAVGFLDGTLGEINLTDQIFNPNSPLNALKDASLFQQAHIECCRIVWTEDIHLDPEALYQEMA